MYNNMLNFLSTKDLKLFTGEESNLSPVEQISPPDEELSKLLKEIRQKHPNYGAVKMAEAVRKKKPKWYINDRRIRRLLMTNRISLASEKQAQEDETNLDFDLTYDLNKSPTEIFDLLEQRGRGTFGTVFKAIHKSTAQIVAIKRVPIKKDLPEIMKEIEFMKNCNHVNIVKFYGHFITDRHLWIVMEYCGVGSVADILSLTGKTLNEAQISIIVRDALHGLSFLHNQGKMHRDIKAGNIVLHTSGQAKLVDFGVSAEIKGEHEKRSTITGTPYWMAPEVVMEQGYDTRADIWSLGVTCIEMAEGRPPYHGLKPMLVMMQLPQKPPPKLQNEALFQPEFVSFLSQCLIKDFQKRPTADQLLLHPFVSHARKSLHLQGIIGLALEKIANGELDKLQDIDATFDDVKGKEVGQKLSRQDSDEPERSSKEYILGEDDTVKISSFSNNDSDTIRISEDFGTVKINDLSGLRNEVKAGEAEDEIGDTDTVKVIRNEVKAEDAVDIVKQTEQIQISSD